MLLGDRQTADYLLANGARKSQLGRLDGFHAACMGADLEAARQLLEADPQLIDDIETRRSEMLNDAALTNNWRALETMIELGFDINKNGERTPLHTAALEGHLQLVEKLVAAGGDTKLRDPNFHSPPLGFALHARKEDVVAFLDTREMDIFTAASRGKIDQLEARLAEDPARLNQRFSQVRTGEHNQFGTDWFTPLVSAAANDRIDAVRWLLARGADATVDDGDQQTALSVTQDHAGDQVIALMEAAAPGR